MRSTPSFTLVKIRQSALATENADGPLDILAVLPCPNDSVAYPGADQVALSGAADALRCR